jgi:predicted metal-dependent hydrolase
VTKKSARVAELVGGCKGGGVDAHYLGYFECFNSGRFYEAHEVLEHLWLPGRSGPDGDFYKGLIQLAGAFVHLQKRRPQPALALLRTARVYLKKYPARHHGLEVGAVVALIDGWIGKVEAGGSNPLTQENGPKLRLEPES